MPWVVWRLHGFLKTLFFCFLFFCFWGVVLDEIYNFLAPQGTRSPVCWTLTVSSFFFLSFFFWRSKGIFYLHAHAEEISHSQLRDVVCNVPVFFELERQENEYF